ncbi:hypothetical protein LWF01_02990 [Saxibacter everestensis]|uniref:Uncharacterized protein n=1 Tax=Saxibacter everestensis TaxID=2909229 RepID=A0ABY8QX70_9MICO|nr:hypothetical protein LWF01_02990 [Brevibacteriaceae bacterium ZFBP1038]
MANDKPKVNLNLDTLERENTPAPFAFVLKGKRYVTVDPMELGISTAAKAMGDEGLELQLKCLLGDQYDEFWALDLPTWKVLKLAEDAGAHYTSILGTPGESIASPKP